MKRTAKIISAYLISFFFCSCEKKELPVPKHDPGNVLTATVDMDASYKWQVYFSLKTNTVIGKNLKTAWDLGFETMPQGYHIILNAGKSMFSMNTGKTDFASVSFVDTTGFSENKHWDAPSGSFDSTAIGDWRTNRNVYIIDRGYNELGYSLGFEKIQFVDVNDTEYAVRLGPLNSTDVSTLQMKKDSIYNFRFLSFDNGGEMVTAEPPKTEWDIVFTQYTHIFYNPTMPYLVTGCLLNRYSTYAYIDTLPDFSEIAFTNISDQLLSSSINVIGYDWKTFTGSNYITNTGMNYVIRDKNGLYYKLHFTDFYSTSGVKGNPKWEYQQL